MGEKIVEIPARKFKYAGLYSSKEVWGMIFSHFAGRNYTPIGQLEETKDFEEEKHIYKRFLFQREVTDNYMFEVKIKIHFVIKRTVEVTIDKHKHVLDEGTILFSQEGRMVVDDNDYRKPSKSNPWNVFIRFITSYVLMNRQRKEAIQLGRQDMEFIEDQLLTYTNAQNFNR